MPKNLLGVFWIKRSKIHGGSGTQELINIFQDSNNKAQVTFGTDDRFYYFDKRSGSTVFNL